MSYRKTIKCKDRKKGNSILDFPDNYVILNIKTTCHSTHWHEIIDISCQRYMNNRLDQTMRAFASSDNSTNKLTQITGQMVMECPRIKDILPKINTFIGDHIILGQCVYMDINFLHDAYNYEFGDGVYSTKNDCIDIIRMAHFILPNLENYQLSTIASSLNIQTRDIHKSMFHCDIIHKIYQKFKEITENNPKKIDLFKNKHQKKRKAADIIGSNNKIDKSHLFYNKTCVFTGKLSKMIRREAMQKVADIGGHCGDTVTKETNFLILGDSYITNNINKERSLKYKRAEQLQLKGQLIEIISENNFYEIMEF